MKIKNTIIVLITISSIILINLIVIKMHNNDRQISSYLGYKISKKEIPNEGTYYLDEKYYIEDDKKERKYYNDSNELIKFNRGVKIKENFKDTYEWFRAIKDQKQPNKNVNFYIDNFNEEKFYISKLEEESILELPICGIELEKVSNELELRIEYNGEVNGGYKPQKYIAEVTKEGIAIDSKKNVLPEEIIVDKEALTNGIKLGDNSLDVSEFVSNIITVDSKVGYEQGDLENAVKKIFIVFYNLGLINNSNYFDEINVLYMKDGGIRVSADIKDFDKRRKIYRIYYFINKGETI